MALVCRVDIDQQKYNKNQCVHFRVRGDAYRTVLFFRLGRSSKLNTVSSLLSLGRVKPTHGQAIDGAVQLIIWLGNSSRNICCITNCVLESWSHSNDKEWGHGKF